MAVNDLLTGTVHVFAFTVLDGSSRRNLHENTTAHSI